MNKKALAMMMNGRSNGEKAEEYGENRDEHKRHSREAAGAPYKGDNSWHHEGTPVASFSSGVADKWAAGMVNADGTIGPHWTREQVKSLMDQHGIDAELDEFWVVLNGIHSDYCGVAKKHNVSTIGFYIDMAKAWLYDADAVEDKAAAYYDYVVKH